MKYVLVTKSWNGNREIVIFAVTMDYLSLIPGTFESETEYSRLFPGNYVFIKLEDWITKKLEK